MPSLKHPIGFAPSEISSLLNEDVISQHAEEAVFLWTLRERAVTEPHYDLDDISRLDERVEAHLDGLRLAGDLGWTFSKANLENLGPGEVFVASIVAFGAGHRDRMREALLAAVVSPEATSGLISALGWLDFHQVSEWIHRLVEARTATHRVVGLRAAAVHRQDTGEALTHAVGDPDPVVRASALRCIGELGRDDLAAHAFELLRSDDDACRFWSAWALALNGQPEGASQLSTWMTAPNVFADRAIQVALRAMPLENARNHIRQWVGQEQFVHRAIKGAGVLGDPASVPWLVAKMQHPALARLAGESFTMITGVDLAFSDLDDDAPDMTPLTQTATDEAVDDLTDESNLAWPSPKKVADWWEARKHDFTLGVRYIAGSPIAEDALRRTLKSGKQRQRAAAALELVLLAPSTVLFETRARGSVQQRRLG